MQHYYTSSNQRQFITPEMVKSAGKGKAAAEVAEAVVDAVKKPGFLRRGLDWGKNTLNRFVSGNTTMKKGLGTLGVGAGLGGGIFGIPSYLMGRSSGEQSGFAEGATKGMVFGLKRGGGIMGSYLNSKNDSFLNRLGNVFTGNVTAPPTQSLISPQDMQQLIRDFATQYARR